MFRHRILFIITFSFFIISTAEIFLSHGEAIEYYLFPSDGDSYMDLFNSIEGSRNKSTLGIYPPLATIIYKMISLAVPQDFWDSNISGRDNAVKLRASVIGNYILIMHMLFVLFPLLLIIALDTTRSKNERILTAFVVIFSGPLLFTLERGNIILYAFLFTLFFFYLKDSDRKILRETAFLCLAIAANLKFYPAVFGLFLIYERRWKDAMHCVLYGLVLFFIPMLFFVGGLSNLAILIKNLTTFSATNHGSTRGANLNCSISNLCLLSGRVLHKFYDISYNVAVLTGKILTKITFILGIWTFFHVEEKWKKIASLSLLCIFVPGVSYLYVTIFMIPSFIYYYKEESKLIPSILLGIILSFNTIPIIIFSKLTLSFILLEISLLLLALYLLFDGIKNVQSRKMKLLL